MPEAISYARKAMKIYYDLPERIDKDSLGLAIAYHNLADAYAEMDSLGDALDLDTDYTALSGSVFDHPSTTTP